MGFPSWNYSALTAGMVYLHILLWGSMVTFVLALYIFAAGASDQVLVPCAVLLIIATSASFGYLLFHEHNARKRTVLVRTEEVYSAARKPIYIAARVLIALAMLWLLSSGWSMIIAARQPICLDSAPMLRLWQAEGTCKAQRAGAAFSIINLLTVCTLFAYMVTTRDPFGSRLVGRVWDRPTTVTPYRFAASFRLSRGKQGLVLRRRGSDESVCAEKPLPKTPSPEPRPLTPAVGIANPIGLGVSIQSNASALPTRTQAPPNPPSRSTSTHPPAKAPSTLAGSTILPVDQAWQQTRARTTLPDSIPTKGIARSNSAATKDAWRTLHPPMNQLHETPNVSLSSRPHSTQAPAAVKALPTMGQLDINTSHNQTIRSGSAYSYARRHSRNKSAPYIPMVPPKSPRSHTTSFSPQRKRGHVRCTSDPNEMISAHLAAEMDLAIRLEAKLDEVSQMLEAQKSVSKTDGAQTTNMNAPKASMIRDRQLEKEVLSRNTVKMHGSEQDSKERMYARMEWDMLMGKDVSVLD